MRTRPDVYLLPYLDPKFTGGRSVDITDPHALDEVLVSYLQLALTGIRIPEDETALAKRAYLYIVFQHRQETYGGRNVRSHVERLMETAEKTANGKVVRKPDNLIKKLTSWHENPMTLRTTASAVKGLHRAKELAQPASLSDLAADLNRDENELSEVEMSFLVGGPDAGRSHGNAFDFMLFHSRTWPLLLLTTLTLKEAPRLMTASDLQGFAELVRGIPESKSTMIADLPKTGSVQRVDLKMWTWSTHGSVFFSPNYAGFGLFGRKKRIAAVVPTIFAMLLSELNAKQNDPRDVSARRTLLDKAANVLVSPLQAPMTVEECFDVMLQCIQPGS